MSDTMKHVGLSFGGHPVFQSGSSFYELISSHNLKSRANERSTWLKEKESTNTKIIKYDNKWCVFMKMGIARTKMTKEALARRK